MSKYDWTAKAYGLVNAVRINLVPNPSASVNTTGWTGTDTTLTRVAGGRFFPFFSFQGVSTTTATTSSITATNDANGRANVTAGLVYTVSAFVKNTVGATRNMRLLIEWRNSGGSLISTTTGASFSIISGGDWQRINVAATAPATSIYATISLEHQLTNAVIGNTALLDAALFEQSSVLGAYFDGDQGSDVNVIYSWTGTANQSASEQLTINDFIPLENIQTLNINYGRKLSTDPFRGSTVTLTGRQPNLLPPIEIGQIVKVQTVGVTDNYLYDCYVTEFIVDYGFLASEDTWTIICEDALGSAGRAYVTNTSASGELTRVAMNTFGNPVDITPGIGDANLNGTQQVSAINVTNENLLTLFNKIAATEQAEIFNSAASVFSDGRIIKFVGFKIRNAYGLPVAEFTDTTPQASALAAIYERIEFAGLSQTYADKVIVSPNGLADQVAGTGDNVYTVSTFDVTTTQGASTAAYILSTLSTATEVPVTISCIAENQPTDKALAAAKPSAWINIALRGNQYTCKVEGGTISVTPAQTRFTYNLTLQNQNSFNFVLDSTHYGVLDTDRLG